MQTIILGSQSPRRKQLLEWAEIPFDIVLKPTDESYPDDLTIEAFGKAFNRLRQYTPNYAFSTWLFKIASNNCIDFIRRRKAV